MTDRTPTRNPSIDFFNKAWEAYSELFLKHSENIMRNHNKALSITENFINECTDGVAKPLPNLRRGDTMSLLDLVCAYSVITELELKNYVANLCIGEQSQVTASLNRKMNVRARQSLNLTFGEILNEIPRTEECFETIEYRLFQRCANCFELTPFNSLEELDDKYRDEELLGEMSKRSPVVESVQRYGDNNHLSSSLLVFIHALYKKAEEISGGDLSKLDDEQHDLLVLVNHVIKHITSNEISYRILLLALPRKISVALAKQNGTLQGEGTAQFFFTEDGELTELAKLSVSITYGVIKKLKLEKSIGDIGEKCIATAFDMLPAISSGYNQIKSCGEDANKIIHRQIQANMDNKNAPKLLVRVLEAAEKSLGGLEPSLIERCAALSALFDNFATMPFDEFHKKSNSIIENITAVTTIWSPNAISQYTARLNEIMSINENISKLAAEGAFEQIAYETKKAAKLRATFIDDIREELLKIEGKISDIEENPDLPDSEKVQLLEHEVNRLKREIAKLKQERA